VPVSGSVEEQKIGARCTVGGGEENTY
jgi:hypothetical protein